MSRDVRKLVFGASDLVWHKLACTFSKESENLEILSISRGGIVLLSVAEIKALISFAVTAKLICVFVFAYAKIQFSHDAAQITDEVIVNDIELLLHSKTSDKLNQIFF